MRAASFLTSFALLTAVTSAWPAGWDPLGRKGAARIRARQNNDNNNDSEETSSPFDLSFSGRQGNTATTESNTRSGDSNDADATASASSSPDNDDDGNDDEDEDGDDDDSPDSTRTYDPRLPAGGVEMVTPDVLAGAKYYKIKDHVTFGFNFTSLSVTPTAIDILASCAVNQATYTIAANHSVTDSGDDAIQAVTWDTGEYQATASIPLLLGTYTLIIHDAAKDVDATPQAGYLGSWQQFTFGMYPPREYTPLADYVCATCSAAMTGVERQTVGFVLGMVGVTVVSFGWFAGVAGLW